MEQDDTGVHPAALAVLQKLRVRRQQKDRRNCGRPLSRITIYEQIESEQAHKADKRRGKSSGELAGAEQLHRAADKRSEKKTAGQPLQKAGIQAGVCKMPAFEQAEGVSEMNIFVADKVVFRNHRRKNKNQGGEGEGAEI